MKAKLMAALMAMMTVLGATAARYEVTGTVVDDENNPVECATVVALGQSEQHGGTVTDENGQFAINVGEGERVVKFSFVGMETVERKLNVTSNMNIGEVKMNTSVTLLEGVTVTGQLIRREADRFVMQVEDQPMTKGKNCEELLKKAPGVWVSSDNSISINGKKGTKVYINDREQVMSDEQLLQMLRAMSAEDVSKLEIVPQAGVEYSADSFGGVIKITTKRRRADGVMGAVRSSFNIGKGDLNLNPSFNVNAKFNRLTLSASSWYFHNFRNYFKPNEVTEYTELERVITSDSKIDAARSKAYGGQLGAVYDIDEVNTIGAEVQYYGSYQPTYLTTNSTMTSDAGSYLTNSVYDQLSRRNNVSTRLNYIHKLDSLDSKIKVLASYTNNYNTGFDDNHSSINAYGVQLDSIFRHQTKAVYNVFNLGSDLEKMFNQKWRLSAGVKYTYNDMKNHAYYDYEKNGAWIPSEGYNFDINYTENIAAAYVAVNYSASRWQAKLGLRGEYTAVDGTSGVDKNYFDLFPSANINYLLNEKGTYTVSLGYNRYISRPSFWEMSPMRLQISDYSFQTGNPLLRPSYSDALNLNFLLASRYSFTVGFTSVSDEIFQQVIIDPTDDRYMLLKHLNDGNSKTLTLTAYLPIRIADWLNVNLSPTYMMRHEHQFVTGETSNRHMFQANGSISGQLPRGFYYEVSAWGQGRMRFGNVGISSMVSMNAELKKTFGDKWTVSVHMSGLQLKKQIISGYGENYARRYDVRTYPTFGVSLSYNFNSGKQFRARQVESNEDSSRLSGGR